MSELNELTKRYTKFAAALKKIEKVSHLESEQLGTIESALKALGTLDVEATKRELKLLTEGVRQRLNAKLASRRQDVQTAARTSNLAYQRLTNSDKVGVFTITYSGDEVRLAIGSEKLISFDEINGSKVIERLLAEQGRLNDLLLPRERFFKLLKTAIVMAKSEGKVSEGKVKIRDLFPYVVAARQVADDGFCKKPSAKSYVEYSCGALAYELHRFSEHEEGWACGAERINNQGPAMSTQNEALVLPDAAGNPIQVFWIWIA